MSKKAKKKVSKAVAVRKGKGKGLSTQAAWQKTMAGLASKQSARTVEQTGNYISIKGGEFSHSGADLGDTLDVVVLDFMFENTFYDSVYDKDNPSSPACYAIAAMQDELVPADDSPKSQCEVCEDCQHDAWGSGSGKGKACGNHRRLAMIAADDLGQDPDDVEIVLLSVPTASIGNFDKFAKGVEKTLKRPTLGVVCRITFDSDVDFEKLKFKAQAPIDDLKQAEVIMAKLEECTSALEQGYDPSGYNEPKAHKTGKRASKKSASKKSSAAKRSKFS